MQPSSSVANRNQLLSSTSSLSQLNLMSMTAQSRKADHPRKMKNKEERNLSQVRNSVETILSFNKLSTVGNPVMGY